VALLRRTPRQVQPTEDGADYRRRVGEALELLHEAATVVRHAHSIPSGHLRVTAPFDLATGIFGPLVTRFTERYPQISVELVLSDAVLDFHRAQVDVALRASSVLRDSSLIAHKLVDIAGVLVASPAYLSEHGSPAQPKDLAGHRLVVLRGDRGLASLTLHHHRSKQTHRLRLRSAIIASDYAFSREAALAGAGIAEMPDLLARRDFEQRNLVRVLGNHFVFEGAVHLVYPASRFQPAKVVAFRDFLLESFGRGVLSNR
jgi:DNA-binding transcriptional LysR family regulator